MCRYCKHLQELIDLYRDDIKHWKKYCEREERYLKMISEYLDVKDPYCRTLKDGIDRFLKEDVIK